MPSQFLIAIFALFLPRRLRTSAQENSLEDMCAGQTLAHELTQGLSSRSETSRSTPTIQTPIQAAPRVHNQVTRSNTLEVIPIQEAEKGGQYLVEVRPC